VEDGLIEADVDAEIFMDSDAYPHFKPYKLSCDDLRFFRYNCEYYMKKKRDASGKVGNRPMRYDE